MKEKKMAKWSLEWRIVEADRRPNNDPKGANKEEQKMQPLMVCLLHGMRMWWNVNELGIRMG